jgi:hypothetical protein
MSQLLIALASGLVGALISAFLSYKVRLRAKAAEDADERRRIAHVNFLLLTDTVAADAFLQELAERLSKLLEPQPKGYGASHAVASFLAERIAAMTPEAFAELRSAIKPLLSATAQSLDKFEIKQSDLSRMSEVTIYSYHQYVTAVARLKIAVSVVEELLAADRPGQLDAATLHSLYLSYRAVADKAGLLRAAFRKSAALSEGYSLECLQRSYAAAKADARLSFEQSSKLELAKKAIQDTADAAKAPSDG